MYLPSHFRQDDLELVRGLIAEDPLGAIVSVDEDGLHADHVPLLLEPADGRFGVLIGHVARKNALWRRRGDVLVIFRGAMAYISPSWYPTKRETHEVVPTYNYAVAHLHGPLIVHDDPTWVRGAVGKLTKRMEAAFERPWRMGEAPAEYLERQFGDIVGIEIHVDRVEAKWKASQNRNPTDRAGAVEGLLGLGGEERHAMAEFIARAR